jgi:hypothetical protein
MTINLLFLLAFLAMFGITLLAAYYFGREASKTKSKAESIENVRDYLDKTIPNEWTAYKKGVGEGYEQGLRDAEDNPDEPA